MRTYVKKRPKHNLIEDVHQLCRLCLQKSNEQMTIYNDDSPVCPLALRIRMCVGLEVTKEECLSNIICQECFQQLDQIYQFRKKCELTYRKLKSHMMALKEKVLNDYTQGNQIIELEFYKQEPQDNSILDGTFENNLIIASQEHSQELNKDIAVNKLAENNIRSNHVEDSAVNNRQSESLEIAPTSRSPEPQLPEQDGVLFSTFLTNLLVKVGALVLHDDGTLSIPDGGTNTINLEMGDHSQMTVLLAEEVEVPNRSLLTTTTNDTKNIEEDVIGKYIIMEKKPKAGLGKNDPSAKAWARSGVECGKCGKRLSSRGVLARHERIHSGERRHRCAACARAFSTRFARDRHAHLHDAVRPFACSQCPKSFTQRLNLAAHEASHCAAAARPRQLFHCRDCPKVFMHRSGLSRHVSTCSGRCCFICAGCNRVFNERGSLLRHLRNSCPCRQAGNNVDSPVAELATTPNV